MSTFVWTAAVAGNWSTGSNWSISGVPQASPPTAGDDVLVGSGSGATQSNMTIDTGAVCRSANFSGYTGTATHTSGVTLTIGDATAGLSSVALNLVNTMTYTLGSGTSSAINFISTSSTQQTVNSGSHTVAGWTFNGAGGSWLLAGNVTQGATSVFKLTAGTLNDGGFILSGGEFSSSNSNTRTLTKSGNWILSSTSTPWDTGTSTNMTLNDTGTITISDTSSAAKTVQGGSNGSLGTFIVSSSASGSVKFNGNANSFAGITATGVCSIIFVSNSTTTIRSAAGWGIHGVSGSVPVITASTSGTAANISIVSGLVATDWMNIEDSHAAGGAVFYAGADSTDSTGNTGWKFSNAPHSLSTTGAGG